jgi:plasmid stabilization system protein ParE
MVIWADPAKSDLRAIHDFIASDSKYYAKKVVQDIIDRTNILEEYPRIGRKAPRDFGPDELIEGLESS